MNRRVFRIALMVLYMTGGTAVMAAQDPGAIVRRVERTIEHLETLQCTFERTHFMKEADRAVRFSGTLTMKRPYRLRVEYPAQTIVVDGESVWVYAPKNRQVRVSTFIADEETFPTPQGIFGRYARDREIKNAGLEDIGGRTCDVLELVTKKPGDVQVTVWIDRDLGFPVKTMETFQNGDSVTFVLGDTVINEPIGDEVFTFHVPEGVELIDLRE